MNEQGPRPLLDAEEFGWLARGFVLLVGIPLLALFVGLVAGLAVLAFGMVV